MRARRLLPLWLVSCWALACLAAPALAQASGERMPAAAANAWPGEGRITYRVLHGKNGVQLGEARHHWSHDGARYRMETVVETTGVAAMLYSFHYTQRSEGRVLARGLQPERFTVERVGRAPELAEFDWGAQRVEIHRKGRVRSAELRPGDQDVLSLWHQIGVAGGGPQARELTVVSGKVAAPSALEVVGRETLRLPLGALDTVRLKARAKNGRLVLDIWLAEKQHLLPVRVVMTDDKGEVLDQQAQTIELGAPGGAGRTPAKRTE
jgi:hypothetical protein